MEPETLVPRGPRDLSTPHQPEAVLALLAMLQGGCCSVHFSCVEGNAEKVRPTCYSSLETFGLDSNIEEDHAIPFFGDR